MATSPREPKPGIVTIIAVPLVTWAVLGVVAGVLIFASFGKISDAVDDLDRVPLGPGETLELEAGEHKVFLEGEGVNSVLNPEFLVGVTGPDGEGIELDLTNNATYDLGGHEGRSGWEFDAPVDGTYTFSSSASAPGAANIAVGTSNPVTAGAVLIAAGIAIGALGFLLAVALLIILLVARGRSKREALASGPYGGGPGFAP